MATINFRAKKRYWITDIILPGLILCLFLGAGIYYEINPIFLIITLLLLLFLGVKEVLSMWRNYVSVDDLKIEVRIGKSDFNLFWDEVIVAKQVVVPAQNRSPIQHYIMLGTLQGTLTIPNLKYFGRDEVWEAVQARVPAGALEEDAYKNLPDYQQESSKYAVPTKVEELLNPLCVSDHRFFKIFQFIGPIVFILAVIVDWHNGCIVMVPGSLLIVMMSGLMYLIVGHTEVDDEYITRTLPFRQYRIAWAEIERVEIYGTNAIVFYGKNKQLKISGPVSWSGHDKDRMTEYIRSRILVEKIENTESANAAIKRSKNVRVRKRNIPQLTGN